MKHSWFRHTNCTTEQAETLVGQYRKRGTKVERSLNPDYLTWTVSAWLPKSDKTPRSSRTWQQTIWKKL